MKIFTNKKFNKLMEEHKEELDKATMSGYERGKCEGYEKGLQQGLHEGLIAEKKGTMVNAAGIYVFDDGETKNVIAEGVKQ